MFCALVEAFEPEVLVMAMIRKHWKLAIIHLLLIVGGLVVLAGHLTTRQEQSAVAATESESPVAAIDPLTYSRVQKMREELCLTAEDLAALGCSGEQTSAILGSLLGWYRNSQALWEQLEDAQRVAQRQLDEAVTKINVGPKNETLIQSMPRLVESVESAAAARRQHMNLAMNDVSRSFNAEQGQLWSIAASNVKLPTRWRYVDGLSVDQVQTLQRAAYKGKLEEAEQQTLSASARLAMNGASSRHGSAIEGVLSAEASVLPIPPELGGSPTQPIE